MVSRLRLFTLAAIISLALFSGCTNNQIADTSDDEKNYEIKPPLNEEEPVEEEKDVQPILPTESPPLVGNPLQLTSHESNQYQPRWSPDGKKIAYVSEESGNLDIWVMDAEGKNRERLTSDESWQYDPSWSPLGNLIAYVTEENGNPDIYLMTPEGRNKKRITRDLGFSEQEPCWSIDSKKIAFTSNRTGNLDLWIMNLNDSRLTQLTESPQDQYFCQWHENGDILYISEEEYIETDSRYYFKFWVTSPESGIKRGVGGNYPDENFPSWSPEGNNIVFYNGKSGSQGIYIRSLDDKEKVKLLVPGGNYPSISPDGRWLLYQSGETGNLDIYKVPLNPGEFPSPED